MLVLYQHIDNEVKAVRKALCCTFKMQVSPFLNSFESDKSKSAEFWGGHPIVIIFRLPKNADMMHLSDTVNT